MFLETLDFITELRCYWIFRTVNFTDSIVHIVLACGFVMMLLLLFNQVAVLSMIRNGLMA